VSETSISDCRPNLGTVTGSGWGQWRGERPSNLGFILKLKPTTLLRGEMWVSSKAFSSNNWKNGFAINWDGRVQKN
jgi:hypothetical protein